MGYVDYTYYTDSYHGSAIPSGNFAYWEAAAEREINCFTFNRIMRLTSVSTTIKDCVCAIADMLYKRDTRLNGKEALASYSNDGVSGTYADDQSDAGFDARLYQKIYKYLGGTGLTYKGRYPDE